MISISYAQNKLSQQSSTDFRSSIYDSFFCAKNQLEAEIMRFKKRPEPWNKKQIAYELNSVGCWNCTSHRPNTHGYPVKYFNGKTVKLSRYMYEKIKRKIPIGKIIRHTCDNKLCINPQHLISGTYKQNTQDAIRRRRMLIGERNGKSKLTEEQVKEILTSKLNGAELGRKFGVITSTIAYIRRREHWKHVEVD